MTNEKQTKIRMGREQLMSDKKICDLTYTKFQLDSNFDIPQNHRYIKKSEVNFTEWGKELGLDRRTVSTRFKYLLKAKIIQQKGGYYIMPIAVEKYFDVDEKLLRFMLNTMHKDLIKMYLYFVRWHIFCQEKGERFNFSLQQIAEHLNMVEKGKTIGGKHKQKIEDCIKLLSICNLITVSKHTISVPGNQYAKRREILDVKQNYSDLPQK